MPNNKPNKIKWMDVPDPPLREISEVVKQARRDLEDAYAAIKATKRGSEENAVAEKHLRNVQAHVAHTTAMKKPHRHRVREEIKKGYWDSGEYSGPEREVPNLDYSGKTGHVKNHSGKAERVKKGIKKKADADDEKDGGGVEVREDREAKRMTLDELVTKRQKRGERVGLLTERS
jgi:hypothetical protein